MHSCVVLGTITLDLFFIGDSFTRSQDRYELAFGGKYVADRVMQKIGGGGANISIGLTRQGFPTLFWGILDDSLIGDYMRAILVTEGVDTSFIEKKKDSLSVSTLILSPQGERTIITHHPKEKHTYNQEIKKLIGECQWFVLGDAPGNTLEDKIEWGKDAKKRNVKLFIPLTAKECKEGLGQISPLIHLADWIILNAHELADLLNTNYQELDLSQRNYDLVINTKGLIVTDGEKGAYAYARMHRYYQRAITPPTIVDTTGAGDAFASGFLSEFMRTEEIQKSLLAASRNAVSVITQIGAQEGLLKK
jgi:ribokinase